ncbi:MAG: DUF1559 domain-containing protein [Pirellulales bacterium]|nr:DUF1559 domain-containing protein [Pirellulales bacterium]
MTAAGQPYNFQARGGSRRTYLLLRRHGLTLIELLIVVAIIGVVLAMLFPAVQMVRAQASATECVNNMRQLGLALQQFTDKHNGEFPKSVHAGTENSWVYTLAPFLENVDQVRICPNDPTGPTRLEHKGTSYPMSSYICMDIEGAIHNVNHMRPLSETLVAMEGSEQRDPTSVTFDHVHPHDWFLQKNIDKHRVWIKLIAEVAPDRHWSAGKPDRSDGTSHLLFADAHVEARQANVLKGLADDGVNFALPPRKVRLTGGLPVTH